MLNGVINVYKEKGYTSHDVVAKLRGILGQKKIGHTGTLDPDAVGVLPVCLGKGTRLCDMLTGQGKTYEAAMALGITTDTQDLSGKVLCRRPVDVGAERIREAVMSFEGGYEQIPPMYSALKVEGKRLYELARKGIEVERRPRRIEIPRIIILRLEPPAVSLLVECSKGTYIRTLCHDIGEKLGCGAAMGELVRVRTGVFSIEDSLKLGQIEERKREGRLGEIIRPIDSLFSDLPAFTADERLTPAVRNGNVFEAGLLSWPERDLVTGGRLRVYDSAGAFVGIYGYDAKRRQYRPVKMFYDQA